MTRELLLCERNEQGKDIEKMRNGSVIEYVIRAWDKTKEALSSALTNLKRFGSESRKVVKETESNTRKAEDSVSRVFRMAGRLPGVFGRLQTALARFGMRAAGVIGALKVGWDLGTWIDEHVIAPIFGMKDASDEVFKWFGKKTRSLFGVTDIMGEIKKKNEELKRSAEEAAEKWAEAQDDLVSQLERHAKAASDVVSEIDKLAAAYLRLQDAKKAVADAGNDAEVLSLQRDKFEDMLALGRDGKSGQAAQVGKYYDVMIAEKRKERTISNADAAIEKAMVEIEKSDKTIAELKKREVVAEKDLLAAKERLAKVEDGDVGLAVTNARQHRAAMRAARNNVEKAEANLKRISVQRRDAERGSDALHANLDAKRAERQNAEERANLEIDAKKKAYDDYLDEVAKKDREAAEKWARDAAKIEERQRREDEREQERREMRLHRLRVANARNEAAEREKAERDAQDRLAAARSLVSQQWGFYRDKNALAAHLREQDANLSAQEQFAKDLRHITHGRNASKFAELNNINRTWGWDAVEERLGEWRKRKLVSADAEAIMRVGVAQNEERMAAQEYARQTAEASQRAVDALESINNILTAAESE